MTKKILTESENRIVENETNSNTKVQLIEGFQSGKYMTVEEFSSKLHSLKEILKEKYRKMNGNNNS